MVSRVKPPASVADRVLLSSRRRCCLCVYLENREEVCRGQIAHLNHNPSDNNFDNLVWLCFDHHDEYDTKTSQSRGFTEGEIKEYRKQLYEQNQNISSAILDRGEPSFAPNDVFLHETNNVYKRLRAECSTDLGFMESPWRFPLWAVGNRPEFFAFKAQNRADGVCLIERIDLPDGRVAIVAIQTAGNPGISITNSVEELCFQVCERFEIDAHRLVWIEHYDFFDDMWNMVSFSKIPPEGLFTDPEWTPMTPDMWKDLQLRPKKRLIKRDGKYQSMVIKKFFWPSEAIIE